MTSARVALAARNNAEWCDAVARSWCESGVFEDTIWVNRGVAPPLYPNAVTLAPVAVVAAAIMAAQGAFVVKDSFQALDLEPLGFAPLFEANWIWRDPAPAAEADGRAVWRILRDTASLSRWERAWRGDDSGPSPFRPTLLYERDHAFIAAEVQGQIVAGCVASRSATVVGVSNLFGPTELTPGCLEAVQGFAPGLPIVGYEAGAALDAMKSLGFQELGALRVWLRETLKAGKPAPLSPVLPPRIDV